MHIERLFWTSGGNWIPKSKMWPRSLAISRFFTPEMRDWKYLLHEKRCRQAGSTLCGYLLAFPYLSFRLPRLTLSQPFPELPLSFFAFVVGEDVRQDTPGDVLDFVLRNTGIVYLTPLENVKLGGKGDPKSLLSSMGIGEEYWKRSVLQLSGGQQQRVAIARALASDAKVLLADEPTGNLDEATAWDVIDLLKHIAHEGKKCVIVVTHSKELAQAADEVIHIGSIHAASSKPNF